MFRYAFESGTQQVRCATRGRARRPPLASYGTSRIIPSPSRVRATPLITVPSEKPQRCLPLAQRSARSRPPAPSLRQSRETLFESKAEPRPRAVVSPPAPHRPTGPIEIKTAKPKPH